jgi:hypothetical protein
VAWYVVDGEGATNREIDIDGYIQDLQLVVEWYSGKCYQEINLTRYLGIRIHTTSSGFAGRI